MAETFKRGDLVRYGGGSTALARLIEPHAGGWHALQCLGGVTFVSEGYSGEMQRATVEDLETWREMAGHRPGEAREFADVAPRDVPEGFIPMPRNADEAAAMAVLGERWLRDNAPERLIPTDAVRTSACVAACAGIPTQALQGAHFEAADDESPLYELVADEDPVCPKCSDTGRLVDMIGAEHRPDTWQRCDCPKGAGHG